MNPKVEKLRAEREKHVKKVASLTARIEEIDAQILELENTDIIGMVRASSLTPDMLLELIRSMQPTEEKEGEYHAEN